MSKNILLTGWFPKGYFSIGKQGNALDLAGVGGKGKHGGGVGRVV